MSSFTAEQLAQCVVDLKLVGQDEMQALQSQFNIASLSSEELMQVLVRREMLTNYQAARVMRGEKDGYFYGTYKILYLISQGTFARVYRAVDQTTGQGVALKILRKQFAKEKATCERFCREGELGQTLKHPNIVGVYGCFQDRGLYYIVMEFVEGQSLQNFLHVRKKLTTLEATRFIKDIIGGLHFASTVGVQHRDLKLTNVLVTPQGRAKLIDFGLAGTDEVGPNDVMANDPRTVDYAALEKTTEVKRGDLRSDLYFVGCMYYHLLTGVPPLAETRDKMARMLKNRFSEILPIRTLKPKLPSLVVHIVSKAMEINPSLRYQTPGEMLVDVATLLRQLEQDPGSSSDSEVQPLTSSPDVPTSPPGKPMTEDSSSRDQSSDRLPQVTLVICETEVKLQDIFRDKFKKLGYRVLVVSDLQRAVTRATDEFEPAGCIILNGDTMGKRAVEMFRNLTSNPKAQELAAIIILSEQQAPLASQLQQGDKRVVLNMPLKMKELAAAVRRLAPPDAPTRPAANEPPQPLANPSLFEQATAEDQPKSALDSIPDEPIAKPPVVGPSAPSAAAVQEQDEARQRILDPTQDNAGNLGVVDNYELQEELGQGGMGTVYRALHRRMQRMVAIKILASERMSSRRALARFHREIKAMARLNHPNIVIAHDAGETNGRHYLVMEYINGVDLAELVKRCGPLLYPDACEIIRRGAIGLEHAHEHGMVHRDIKPSNLLLEFKNAEVKLLDLGLALVKSETDEELTNSGQVLGTIEYMAPEQWSNTHGVDIRADIYSLGCTMYRLLTGHPPFAGAQYPNMLAKMMAHAQNPIPDVRKRRPEIPDDVQHIIEKMLAKSPGQRYATPQQVADALKPHCKDSNLPALVEQARNAKKD